jgi:hypothetical protein
MACTGGGMPERPKGPDCKSGGGRLRRFESCSPHQPSPRSSGVERVFGKDEVTGSNPVVGSILEVSLNEDHNKRRRQNDGKTEI